MTHVYLAHDSVEGPLTVLSHLVVRYSTMHVKFFAHARSSVSPMGVYVQPI